MRSKSDTTNYPDLLAKCKAGNEDAFRCIFNHYYQPVKNNIARFVADSNSASDILQDVFLALWEQKQTLAPDTNIENWLFSVSYYKSISFIRKAIKYMHKSCFWNNTTKVISYKSYVFPNLRLAELYLNYAEADFEYNGNLNGNSLQYLNKIRARAGLPNFEASWALVGGIPAGDQLRDVLHQERIIELMMEGRRYSDIRRWGIAQYEMTKPQKAWNVKGKTQADFNKIVPMVESGVRVFENPKTIWLAIPIEELNKNPNMVQNPGY